MTLSEWFWTHGSPSLLLDPIPEVRESNRAIEPQSGLWSDITHAQYVGPVTDNPYDNPDLPPEDDNPDGVCGMKWSEDQLSPSGARKYWLR